MCQPHFLASESSDASSQPRFQVCPVLLQRFPDPQFFRNNGPRADGLDRDGLTWNQVPQHTGANAMPKRFCSERWMASWCLFSAARSAASRPKSRHLRIVVPNPFCQFAPKCNLWRPGPGSGPGSKSNPEKESFIKLLQQRCSELTALLAVLPSAGPDGTPAPRPLASASDWHGLPCGFTIWATSCYHMSYHGLCMGSRRLTVPRFGHYRIGSRGHRHIES